MECGHCKSILATKYSLNTHMKTNKKCINIQKNKGIDIESIKAFVCEYCKTSFTSKDNYKNHMLKSCKEKFEVLEKKLHEIIQEKDKIIQEKDIIIATLLAKNELLLEDKNKSFSCIEEIAKQPKIQSNKQTLNMMTPLSFDKKDVKNAIKDAFNNNYFYDGQKGVAKFAVDNLLKDSDGKLKYICTDPSRNIFKFRDEDGDMKKDVKAKKLTELLAPELKRKACFISKEELDKYSDNGDMFIIIYKNEVELRDLDTDNTVFRNELSALTTEK